MITVTTEHNVERLIATRTYVDAGNSPAKLELFDCARATVNDAPAAPPLVTCFLANPSGVVNNLGYALTQAEDAIISGTGNPTWARITSRAGLTVADLSVRLSTDPATDGEIVLPYKASEASQGRTLFAGGVFRIAGGTLV